MNASASLLSVLLALGIAVVALFWGVNARNVARKAWNEEVVAIKGQADSDFVALENDLENSKA